MVKRVLLIDDDPNEHKLFDCYFTYQFGKDYYLHSASCLEDGIRALTENEFDAVFLDNRLKPYRDFRQTLPRLTGFLNDIRIFVISACVDDRSFCEISRFPVDGVLDKFEIKERLQSGLLT